MGIQDRISELPDDILYDCLSLLEMKNAAQTSIFSTKWRYLWTHFNYLDFDPKFMYPEEYATFWERKGKCETDKYFAWINQVVDMHRGPSINKFRVHLRYDPSYATHIRKWVKFALSKSVKELVLDFIGFTACGKFNRGYPLGFHILRHPPCYTGLTALQSLHLNDVNVSEAFLEFLFSHCHHLERLYLEATPLSNLKVKTSKLKYLTILMRFHDLEELEIDAENLLYFKYDDMKDDEGGPHMVFKNLPMLVETNVGGGFCRYPFFPIFEKFSRFTNQLCKLFLEINIAPLIHDLVIANGVVPAFPNVKHFSCAARCLDNSCIGSLKRFIEACPMLEEFNFQVAYYNIRKGSREASELQEIDLEDEKKNVETKNEFNYSYDMEKGQVSEVGMENMNEEKHSHLNLRILKLVGFLGVRCDVQFALAVLDYARSLKAIICDPRGLSGDYAEFLFFDQLNEYDGAKKRARKLAKIVSPKVNVVIL